MIIKEERILVRVPIEWALKGRIKEDNIQLNSRREEEIGYSEINKWTKWFYEAWLKSFNTGSSLS